MRVVAGLLAAMLFLAPVHGETAETPPGWQAALASGSTITVRTERVEIGGQLWGLVPEGAWRLRADSPLFGGFSGLLAADGWLYGVSDIARWFAARPVIDDGKLRLESARLAPMRDAVGETYDKAGGDAEALARWQGDMAVAFERDHRLMRLRASGRLGGTVQARAFERLPSNAGLEALATLPDGRMIAFAEARKGAAVPVFLIRADGTIAEGRLTLPDDHAVTGADVGPDGRLYLLLRRFSVLVGISVRVLRLELDPEGFPVAATAETLATFGPTSGIDNMEGIAVERGADGRSYLWLVSDDNFSMLQRTLLLRFWVTR